MKHDEFTPLDGPLLRCHGCHLPLPAPESGEGVLGVPGVGIFHGRCGERLMWRERLLALAHRLLMDRPRAVAVEHEPLTGHTRLG